MLDNLWDCPNALLHFHHNDSPSYLRPSLSFAPSRLWRSECHKLWDAIRKGRYLSIQLGFWAKLVDIFLPVFFGVLKYNFPEREPGLPAGLVDERHGHGRRGMELKMIPKSWRNLHRFIFEPQENQRLSGPSDCPNYRHSDAKKVPVRECAARAFSTLWQQSRWPVNT